MAGNTKKTAAKKPKQATKKASVKKVKVRQVINEERRDFFILSAQAMGVVGAVAAFWPFIDSMNPAADVLALSSTEVDISGVATGESLTVMWRGMPVFIKRRTAEEIKEAQDADISDLPDPQTDAQRVIKGKEEWLVTIGICTHLGCVPLENADGWFCPCHGSYYDTSGRITKGPAPKNLAVPEYKFLDDNTIKIG